MNYETALEAEAEAGEITPFDADDQRERRRRLMMRAGIALAILLVLAAIAQVLFGEGSDDGKAVQLPVVSVTIPGKTTIPGTIQTTGTLAARREMPVGSVGEGGRVVSVPVEAGQWVRRGQVLAVIDRSVQAQQISGAVAQTGVARADAALAQANLERGLKLVERGFISKADIDRLRATRDAAAARVRVAEAGAGELRARAARLDILAPADGLLLSRNVEPGQVVAGGSGVLFSIAKGGELELLARLSEEDLAALSPGVAAEVTPVASPRHFTGHVWQILPTIDPQTRQGTARIALAYAPELRPGGFASATIRNGTINAPVLPESAVLSDEKGSFVLVVGDKGVVSRRAVKTGFVTERGPTIVEGLTGKEKVVLRAGGFLSPGDRVEARLVRQPAG
jgi:RND family efflux transporter MFP subunit